MTSEALDSRPLAVVLPVGFGERGGPPSARAALARRASRGCLPIQEFGRKKKSITAFREPVAYTEVTVKNVAYLIMTCGL